MYSSPGTPTGTGCSARVQHVRRVLASGRPMGTDAASPPAAPAAWSRTNVVFSVGPYTLTSTRPRQPLQQRSRTRSARQRLAADQHALQAAPARPAAAAATCSNSAAVSAHVLMPALAAAAPPTPPAPARAAAAPRTSCAPVQQRPHSSNVEASKASGASCSQHRPPARQRTKSSAHAASRAIARCGTLTPLGRPVEPDV